MKKKKLEDLIAKFISKSINQDELEELSIWVEKEANIEIFKRYIEINYALEYNLLTFDGDKAIQGFLDRINSSKKEGKARKIFYLTPLKVAAALALLVAATYFIYLSYDNISEPVQITVTDSKVLPGTDKAVLTLENGEYVALEKGKEYSTVGRTSNGEKLLYDEGAQSGSNVQFNYLTIPKGGQFYVQLSDGSQVWLNADSKLKYPVRFPKGQPREVELLYGEAYFDVSPSYDNSGDSFRVKNQGQTIEVLGTEFNIKSYQEDSSYYTTLVEGSIAIGNGLVNKLLSEGQQAMMTRRSEQIEVREVDVDYEIAWKNGLFMFRQETLESMLGTLSRWYDVKVVFENQEMRQERFSGVLRRSQNIEYLLDILQKTGDVEFVINDKQITVK